MKHQTKTILISRTDNIGDVILTLPMLGIIKKYYPDSRIIFLGKTYTKPILQLCDSIDDIIYWDELSKKTENEIITIFNDYNIDVAIHVFPNKTIAKLIKKVGIKVRIGTSHRFFHFFTCNKRVKFSRIKSNLHEAELNINLLKPLKIKNEFPVKELYKYYGIRQPSLTDDNIIIDYYHQTKSIDSFFDEAKINLVLHPKTKGSAREWGIENFGKLIEALDTTKYKIFITGTKVEGEMMRNFLYDYQDIITDVTGVFSLEQFIYFLSKTDGLVAASTGPLHIAAMLNKYVLGIYAPMRPIFPKRWAPLGQNTEYMVTEKVCNQCKHSNFCECIQSITPDAVKTKIDNFFEQHFKQ